MAIPSPSMLEYYAEPGTITRLDRYRPFLDWLAEDIRAICQVVQGILIHDSWIEQYGAPLEWSYSYDIRIAYMEDLLDKGLQLEPRSLALPRAPEQRVVCSLLKNKRPQEKVALAARVGFNLSLNRIQLPNQKRQRNLAFLSAGGAHR